MCVSIYLFIYWLVGWLAGWLEFMLIKTLMKIGVFPNHSQ